MASSEFEGEEGVSTESRRIRMAIFLSVPVALVIGGVLVWLLGGRYVTTENAYVKRDMLTVSAEISGPIARLYVRENQLVEAGEVLFHVDQASYRIQLAEAEAHLAEARIKVAQLRAAYGESLADVANAQQAVEFQNREYDRRAKLRASGYAAQADLDRAAHNLETARQKLATEQKIRDSALAALGGNPEFKIEQHPAVLQAKTRVDTAKLNLARTEIRSPISGVVAKSTKLVPGHFVSAGTPTLSIVKRESPWIEANFKETDLTHMAVGQEAKISFDAYPGHEFKARVESIGAATGAEFSLLPPQNASGNWVKVVQRVPVRLEILQKEADDLLQAGLSARVKVDTGYSRIGGATAAPTPTFLAPR